MKREKKDRFVGIQRLEIENFQSHKNTVLDFKDGVNVIVGLSDSGKSALVRALLWVFTNRPLGEAFRSTWGGDTRVAVYFGDGHVVERVRTASKNVYKVDGLELKAVGTEVPEEVNRIMLINPFLNVQTQADSFFLLRSTAGEVARYFNEVAGLQEIDVLIQSLTSDHNLLNRNIRGLQGRQENLEKDLEEVTAEIHRRGVLVKRLERVYNRIKDLDLKRLKLTGMIRKVEDVSEYIGELSGALENAPLVDAALGLCEKLDVLRVDRAQLERQLKQIWRAQTTISNLESVMVKAPVVDKAMKVWVKLEGLTGHKSQLERKLQAVEKGQGKREGLEKKLKALKDSFVREFPSICPLCGQPVHFKEV